MIDGRRFITAIIGGLVVAAAVYADMVPVSQLDAGRRQLLYDCRGTGVRYTDLSSPSNFPGFA